MKKKIFVFGSNLAGIHGAGAARYALNNHGAVWGQGEGLQGTSYAIPTKDENIQTLPLEEIKKYVDKFLEYAKNNPEMIFMVTAIGTGLAGIPVEDIAPFFKTDLENVKLPLAFLEEIKSDYTYEDMSFDW